MPYFLIKHSDERVVAEDRASVLRHYDYWVWALLQEVQP